MILFVEYQDTRALCGDDVCGTGIQQYGNRWFGGGFIKLSLSRRECSRDQFVVFQGPSGEGGHLTTITATRAVQK